LDPIFDKNGKVVGWLRRNGAIADRLGQYRAFVHNGAVYDYHSHFLGGLHDGFFLDRDGKIVAFIPDAKEGPTLPSTGAVPQSPVIGPEPARPSKPLEPRRIPAYSKKWSELNWDDFLTGRHLFIAYRR
jgi:hypothetical protein